MQNVEYKAELRDPELARLVCKRAGAVRAEQAEQVDTYFRIPDGRLKRREVDGQDVEYIFYHRANRLRPKLSHFTIYSRDEAKRRFGQLPLPVWLVVRKQRETWMYKNVRIHIDSVEHLGQFIEIEALVSPTHHAGQCHMLVDGLRDKLGPTLGEPIAGSYSDLMALELETSDGTAA
jgi:adenylate cyclase class 2